MRSHKELRDAGIEYKRCRWRWVRPGYMLETAEFSDDGEFWNVDYSTYLGMWANRLNGRHIVTGKFEVIGTTWHDHNYITLVEIVKEVE